MRLYRIGRQAYLEDYRGLGASYLDGGRWNAAGIPALYFAETASVAMLEMANYLPSPRLVPTSYRLGIFGPTSTTPGRSVGHLTQRVDDAGGYGRPDMPRSDWRLDYGARRYFLQSGDCCGAKIVE